jgi:hypothetical protein
VIAIIVVELLDGATVWTVAEAGASVAVFEPAHAAHNDSATSAARWRTAGIARSVVIDRGAATTRRSSGAADHDGGGGVIR